LTTVARALSRSWARRPTPTPAPSPRAPRRAAGTWGPACGGAAGTDQRRAVGCAPGRRSTNGRSARRRRRRQRPVGADEAVAARRAAGDPAEPGQQQADTPPRSPTPSRRREPPTSRGRARRGLAPGSANARLIRAGEPVGREKPGHGVDFDLHRNLQAQIAGELDKLTRTRAKRRRWCPQGAREFLCLLNYEDAVRATLARAQPSAPWR